MWVNHMKYLIKRNWFELASGSLVHDEKGRQAFRIGGTPASAAQRAVVSG